MSSVIGAGVSLNGIFIEDFMFPFNLKSGITSADVGKAVAIDATAANTVKLAGDLDPIIGRLEVVEDRKSEGILVGTVAMKGSFKFPVKAAQVVNVGDSLQGAGAGEVKSGGSGLIVVEVGSGYAVAILK